MKFKNLGKRVAIGLLLFFLVVLVVVCRGWIFGLGVSLFAIICQIEMFKALRAASFRPGVWPGIAFAALMYPVFLWKGLPGLIAVFTILCAVLIALSVTMPRRRFLDTVVSVFAMVYPCWFFFFLLALNGGDWRVCVENKFSQVTLALALIGPIASDVGGYFGGGFFGKHKLSPSTSPKKTVEGAIGAILFTIMIFALGGFLVRRFYYNGIPFIHFIPMAILVSVLAQAGDLMASSIKRYAGIKDFSNFLPGHGGFMDRMDSILFGGVAVYCYLELFFF